MVDLLSSASDPLGNIFFQFGSVDPLVANKCTVVQTLTELVQAVFSQLHERYKDTTWLAERAILAPRNDAVRHINDTMLTLIPKNEKVYMAIDTTMEQDALNIPPKFLIFSIPPDFPPTR